MIDNTYNIYQYGGSDHKSFLCSLIVDGHSRDTNFRIVSRSGTLATGYMVGKRYDLNLFKECNSLREQMTHYDELFEIIGDEPIIYTVYDKDDSLYKIALLDTSGLIFLFYPSLNTVYSTSKYTKDVNALFAGKNSEHYTIINEFDSVKDALMSDEMLTYEDVLNSL